MTNLDTMLPELSVFPVFGSAGSGKNNHFPGRASNGLSEEELASRLSAAHSLGLAEGSEAARAETAKELDDLRAMHRQEMEDARRKWVEETGDQSISLIGKALADLEAGIAQSLQEILAPFIEKTIPLAAMAELERILEGALKDDFKGPLFLSGPEDLVEGLKLRLKPKGIDVILETPSGTELKARSGDFSITSRVKSWIDGIQGAD